MWRESGRGTCESCGAEFPYMLIHNGFNDTAYAYCDSCGRVGTLGLLGHHAPGLKHGRLEEALVARLPNCTCGGHFSSRATPRCPACHASLDPVLAAGYIERDAPGARGAWRWSRTWTGIESFSVTDNPIEHEWTADGGIRRL